MARFALLRIVFSSETGIRCCAVSLAEPARGSLVRPSTLTQENRVKKRYHSIALAVVLGALCSLPAHSQIKPETAVKQRQSAMTLQGKYFYPIRAMAQGKASYDASVVTRNVGYLDALSKMPWDGFIASTKDVKSGAMPAVF